MSDDEEIATSAAVEAVSVIECVTQHPAERDIAGPAYLAICTKTADLLATSTHCPEARDGGECGGHPICRCCYALAKVRGLLA